MKFLKSTLAIGLLLMFSVACVQQFGDTPIETGNMDDAYANFDFGTVSPQQISILLTTQDKTPISGVVFKLWTNSPLAGGEIILKGITDKTGSFITDYNLPSTVEQLVLETDYIGLANYIVLSRADFYETITINGMDHKYKLLSDELTPHTSNSNSTVSGITNGRVMANYVPLGTYNSSGVPNYLEPVRDVISAEMLTFINASLPEGRPVPTYHPKYIAADAQTNLVITKTADVWMTFVHEGAGYRNTLGFYTYPTGNPPTKESGVQTIKIAFPNASFVGSGGGLRAGDKVNLGRFEPGTTIGFALLANGWNGSSITGGLHQVYSDNVLNPEKTAEKRSHSVLLWDEQNQLFLIGFEDLNRDGSSDEDFNDAMFFISSNPVEAISRTNVNPIDEPTDTDGDGVSNVYDEFPTDPKLAYNYQYPGNNTFGTFAFEDQWPRTGDYDFNDLVVDYQYDQYANATNKLVKIKAKFVIKAVGAGFTNAFGIQLNSNSTAVSSVKGNDISGSLFKFNANGTESQQSKAVIIVSDDVHHGFNGRGFINTTSNLPYQTPDTLNVEVAFTTPMVMSSVGSAPYNPFLVINGQRGREVHIPSYAPTDLVDATLFGTENDNSKIGGVYYRSKTGLPWGMNMPVSFDYPMEKTDLRKGYNHFHTWAESGGYTYMDWYTDKPNFRSKAYLYSK